MSVMRVYEIGEDLPGPPIAPLVPIGADATYQAPSRENAAHVELRERARQGLTKQLVRTARDVLPEPVRQQERAVIDVRYEFELNPNGGTVHAHGLACCLDLAGPMESTYIGGRSSVVLEEALTAGRELRQLQPVPTPQIIRALRSGTTEWFSSRSLLGLGQASWFTDALSEYSAFVVSSGGASWQSAIVRTFPVEGGGSGLHVLHVDHEVDAADVAWIVDAVTSTMPFETPLSVWLPPEARVDAEDVLVAAGFLCTDEPLCPHGNRRWEYLREPARVLVLESD